MYKKKTHPKTTVWMIFINKIITEVWIVCGNNKPKIIGNLPLLMLLFCALSVKLPPFISLKHIKIITIALCKLILDNHYCT